MQKKLLAAVIVPSLMVGASFSAHAEASDAYIDVDFRQAIESGNIDAARDILRDRLQEIGIPSSQIPQIPDWNGNPPEVPQIPDWVGEIPNIPDWVDDVPGFPDDIPDWVEEIPDWPGVPDNEVPDIPNIPDIPDWQSPQNVTQQMRNRVEVFQNDMRNRVIIRQGM